jgi:hypothetical protein
MVQSGPSLAGHGWFLGPDSTSIESPGEAAMETAEQTSRTRRLFITYAREDRELVQQLRGGLERLRHEVWVDDRLSVGQEWWAEILDQIRRCDALIVALSPALLESQASATERAYARQLGKVLLPVCVRPVRPELLPADLAHLQLVDYCTPGAPAAFELADALAHVPASPPLPEPPPPDPEIPLSYLTDLAARVHAPALSVDDQLALVGRLQTALGKGPEREPARELLLALQRRDDLYHVPARQIERVLAEDDRASGRAPSSHATGSGRPASPPPQRRDGPAPLVPPRTGHTVPPAEPARRAEPAPPLPQRPSRWRGVAIGLAFVLVALLVIGMLADALSPDVQDGRGDTVTPTEPTEPTVPTGEPTTEPPEPPEVDGAAELDELWDLCEAGDGAACNQLWIQAPAGSEYEDFGGTCGWRFADWSFAGGC